MFTFVNVQADRAQRVVVGVRVAEAHLVQSYGDRRDRRIVGRRVQFVHIGDTVHPIQHPRQRPPTDQGHDHDRDDAVGEDQPRPVVQRLGEQPLQPAGARLEPTPDACAEWE